MSHGGRDQTVILIALALGAGIYLLVPMSLPFSAVSMAVGLAIVLLVGEPMVEGLKELGRRTGVSDHIVGIASSIASNLPEAVMTLFMIASPHLREVAILTVLLASAFNGLLLGVMVVMVTYRGGTVEMPKDALEHDVELMRVTIAFCMIVFGTGVIMGVSGADGGQVLPWEVPLFQLVSYAGYLYFLGRGPEKRRGEEHAVEGGASWAAPIVLGLVGIVLAAQLISGSAEFLVHMFDLHVVIAATVIGFAGSVPEHGLAILGARRGHVELGVSNLLSGIVQSVMLIFPVIALLVPVPLDGYVLYQFLAIAVTLWIVKKSIVDDGRLTIDEGLSIVVIHVLGVLLFDELSLLI
jgi:cation:H+ antiporter